MNAFGEFMGTVYVTAYREIKRFLRSRSRIVGSIINPIIWMVFFGIGFSRALSIPGIMKFFGGIDYLSYLAPGVAAMAIFTASLISGITLIFDKQFGFFKEVLVAPAPRSAALLGRAIGDGIAAVLQGALMLLIAYPLARSMSPTGIPVALVYGFLVSIGFASLGILLASKISSHEGFQLILNFLMLPIIFLSSAFYPIEVMPAWMKVLALINPLTYAVDGMRFWLLGSSSIDPVIDLLVLALLAAVLTGAAVRVFEKATLE